MLHCGGPIPRPTHKDHKSSRQDKCASQSITAMSGIDPNWLQKSIPYKISREPVKSPAPAQDETGTVANRVQIDSCRDDPFFAGVRTGDLRESCLRNGKLILVSESSNSRVEGPGGKLSNLIADTVTVVQSETRMWGLKLELRILRHFLGTTCSLCCSLGNRWKKHKRTGSNSTAAFSLLKRRKKNSTCEMYRLFFFQNYFSQRQQHKDEIPSCTALFRCNERFWLHNDVSLTVNRSIEFDPSTGDIKLNQANPRRQTLKINLSAVGRLKLEAVGCFCLGNRPFMFKTASFRSVVGVAT